MLKTITLALDELQTNCHIVYDDETFKSVIIDPGAEADEIISVIENNSLTVEALILTHGHFDHIGAADVIAENYSVDIIINQNDKCFLTNSDYNLSSRFYSHSIVAEYKNVITVTDEKITLLDREFEFISTPGHSPGSMCIKAEDLLFTGDTLFYMSVGNEFAPFGSFSQEIESIKNKLFKLKGDCVCYTGHGPATTLDYERKNNPYMEQN